jgi:predicted MFS family arabinose efflux permease
MSLTMYDPAFATLSQHAGDRYRRSMSAVTLMGGFAGTVFWPLTTWLQTHWGWRGAFYSFVAMQLLICFPLHWFLIPKRQQKANDNDGPVASKQAPTATETQARVYRWLVTGFSLHAYVMAVNAVHLLSILQGRGLTLNEAVIVGMVIGPMQVAGRIVDMSIGGGIAPKLLGTGALAIVTASMLLLALPGLDYTLAFLVAGLWGSGNGLITIVKSVSIAQIFGRNDYGAWMGRMARWNFVVHSIAPASFAYLLSVGLGYEQVGWLLGAIAAAATVCYYMALRKAPKEQ